MFTMFKWETENNIAQSNNMLKKQTEILNKYWNIKQILNKYWNIKQMQTQKQVRTDIVW